MGGILLISPVRVIISLFLQGFLEVGCVWMSVSEYVQNPSPVCTEDQPQASHLPKAPKPRDA